MHHYIGKLKLTVLVYIGMYCEPRPDLYHSCKVLSTYTHCSYLDIYISQKIRLCTDDFEGKFQFNLQAKSITFLGWKFRSITFIFLLFFAEFVKFTAFYTLYCYSKELTSLNCDLMKKF
jgi:hypothetical protein